MRRRLYVRAFVRYGVVGALLLSLLVTLTDQWMWPWLLGRDFAGLAELTSLIVWALPFLVVGLACQQMLSSLGRFWWYAGVLAPAAVLQTILLVVLSPVVGPAAVAWATLAAFGLWALLGGLAACRGAATGRPGPDVGHDG
jgi:O-antigen/teichoic acid export membrane protein